jgi:gliding motility-associated-like protein
MYRIFLLSSFLSFIHFYTLGTHIRAGEIAVRQEDCGKNIMTITVIIYGNTLSPVSTGGGILSFGDGNNITIPLGSLESRPDLPIGFGVFTYSITREYNLGTYTISYNEINRNFGILNILNSGNSPFYTETTFSINESQCNNSPQLLSPPIDRACSRLAFFHNPGAFDIDGDSLAYTISVPSISSTQQASYIPPNSPQFYTGSFNQGNERGDGPPQFTIDPVIGTITWDAPGAIGEYNIAFIVEEWRKVDNTMVKIGSVKRDMQILVEECNNRRPGISIPEDLCVFAGTPISETITGTDPDGHNVKIEFFSGIFLATNNPAVYNPFPADYQPSIPPASIFFNWTPSCGDVRNQPYSVLIKITDQPPSGPPLVQFKTWNIKVVAPRPELQSVDVNVLKRETEISWIPYGCESASAIQIWRRVSPFQFSQDDCSFGLPAFTGYQKIAELPPDEIQFTDDNNGTGLAPGAVYCYRLIAIFPLPGGAESQVSFELCSPPILADAPVITNVTVDKTNNISGEITVSWLRPYDLDQAEFLEPYQYIILRSKGLFDDNELTRVNLTNIIDTTFTDKGLNTRDYSYNYRIILLAKKIGETSLLSIDTSAVASSVWNSSLSRTNSIELTWEANTPWINISQDYPFHLIYRSSELNGLENFILIDSINVFENGYRYEDSGEYLNSGINENEFYCYRIKTRGTYGNPEIQIPLENFSQTVCTTLLDLSPPCSPSLIISEFDCSTYTEQIPCSQEFYSHKILWPEPDNEDCQRDIFYYKVFASDYIEDDFQLIGSTTNNSFTEDNLVQLARCYRVKAVDRAGNESEFSEPLCFDNCPSIYFPNIITPNKDSFNENFIYYNANGFCTRFIKGVSLSLFNRWGERIVDISYSETLSWNGRDESGKLLPAGIYFYEANVLFDVKDVNQQAKRIKGWLHIVY